MASHTPNNSFKNKIIAHRGWQSRHPENSLSGISQALHLGIQHIEIDINLSADHVPVLCHDANLQRLCGIDKNVQDCTYKQLMSFSFHEPKRLGNTHNPTPIFSLSDCAALIAQHPEATLYVEIKTSSLLTFGREIVLNALTKSLKNIMRQVALISFDLDVLLLAKQTTDFNLLIPVLRKQKQWYDGSLTILSPKIVFCDIKLIPSTPIKQLPFPVAIYEIDDYHQAKELIHQGALLIESFTSGELLAADQAANQALQ